MKNSGKIQLDKSCISNVPFQTYDNDFSFFVNGKEFKTSRIISDILSPKICQIHQNDPTLSIYVINTEYEGDFSYILKLISFNQIDIPENELLFIEEVVEILENDSIKLNSTKKHEEITLENVFSRIQKFKKIRLNRIQKEIEFVASHFHKLAENHKEDFEKLDVELLVLILSNKQLKISDEDQLLNFVNYLYKFDSKNSILYEYVDFLNATTSAISEFIDVFDINDLTSETWLKLCMRLKMAENQNNKKLNSVKIPFESNEFSGIFKYFRDNINDQIEKEIDITSSTCQDYEKELYLPKNIVYYEKSNAFWSDSKTPNNWICFDFKNYRVTPTDYSLKTYGIFPNRHPKSWVIEGSIDNESWETLDEQKDCTYTQKSNSIHLFNLNKQNSNEYKYIRFRSTGPDWSGLNHIILKSFELFGTLFKKEQ